MPDSKDSSPRSPSWLARLLPWNMPQPAAVPNGNGGLKSHSGVVLDPRIQFHSPDGGRTFICLTGAGNTEASHVSLETAYLVAAYAYAAISYRASTLSRPPLTVAKVDQKDGTEKWMPRHPLARLLKRPAPEYAMRELLFRTSCQVDVHGRALWKKDKDLIGGVGRLSLFGGREFRLEATRTNLRGKFTLFTENGDKDVKPEEVVFFHEPHLYSWQEGHSRLETFLSWLNLAQQARATVRDLLKNAIWPSVIFQPDHEWNPTPAQFEEYKEQAAQYAEQKGGGLPMLGGGTATVVSARVRDLVPEEVFNRVESVCSSVFRVPAIILQFMVGMENAPWSQMGEARRMFTEDTMVPLWDDDEELLTEQLLRPMDPDESHVVRFDKTRVAALQQDKLQVAQIAVQWGRQASLNERRDLLGLEPSDDPKADEIPELTQPDPLALMGGEEEEETDEGEEAEDPKLPPAKRRAATGLSTRQQKTHSNVWAQVRAQSRDSAVFELQLEAYSQLRKDAEHISRLAAELVAEPEPKGPAPERGRRFMTAVIAYLTGDSQKSWQRALGPLVTKTANRAGTALAANLDISWSQLKPGVLKYAEREAGWLVKEISDTTRDKIARALAAGLEAGEGAAAIAGRLRDLPAFDKTRALLVARTEATRINNGAPTEALLERQRATGRSWVKRWNTALDERVRDEHEAMEGETVKLDESFSNGLDFPSEPNCRCVLTYEELEQEPEE